MIPRDYAPSVIANQIVFLESCLTIPNRVNVFMRKQRLDKLANKPDRNINIQACQKTDSDGQGDEV